MNIEEYLKISLAMEKKARKQTEGKLQIQFGTLLRGRWRVRLNPNVIFFTYSGAGEKKSKTTALWQYKKGLMKGAFDYQFHLVEDNILKMIFLELKSDTGGYTKEQKQFYENHKNLHNVAIGSATTIEEIEQFLINNKIFII